MKLNYHWNQASLEQLAKYVILAASQTDILSDITTATDSTWSSYAITQKLQAVLADANQYTDEITSSLVKLTVKLTTEQPTLGNSELNVIYLYSPSGNAPYEQYLKISPTQLVDMGSTSISITDYYTKTQADGRFATITNLNLVSDSVINKVSINQGVAKAGMNVQISNTGLVECVSYESTNIDWSTEL